MKFTFAWLQDHLDTSATFEEICDGLLKIGTEIEQVINYKEIYSQFVIAYVKSVAKHQDADKLSICQIATPFGDRQVVCGAHNVRADMYVVFAPSGSVIPETKMLLKDCKIRGVDSFGMLVSERELNFGNDHDGIIEISVDNNGDSGHLVGMDIATYFAIDDIMLDIAITPNKGHLLGVRGIANELAILGYGTLKPLVSKYDYHDSINTLNLDVKVNRQISNYFSLYHLTNLNNHQSLSQQIKSRLFMVGKSLHNPLVDWINYLMLDVNQPMHCYDANKLAGSKQVQVDFWDDSLNDQFLALDDIKYSCYATLPLVKFDQHIGAIAGIIGGVDSSCDSSTTEVLLEIAHFDHDCITNARRSMGITSESAYRYERKVDSSTIEQKSAYILGVLQDNFANLSLESYAVFQQSVNEKQVVLYYTDISHLLGMSLSKEQIINYCEQLQLKIIATTQDSITCVIPLARDDLLIANDIIGEIIKLIDINQLPPVSLMLTADNFIDRQHNHDYQISLLAKQIFANLGFLEAINLSFIDSKHAELFEIYQHDLLIENPVSSTLNIMRGSIIPSLINNVFYNFNYAIATQKLFEVAPLYGSQQQMLSLGFAMTGVKINASWRNSNNLIAYDVFDAKELIGNFLQQLGIKNPYSCMLQQENLPSYYHPYRSAKLSLGKNNIIAYFGELNPRVMQALDIDSEYPLIIGEIMLDALKIKRLKTQHVVIPNLLPITRDLVFIADLDIPVGNMISLIYAVNKKLITKVQVFDLYQDSKIGENKHSIAFRITIQPIDNNLVDNDIQVILDQIVEMLANKCKAILSLAYFNNQ